MREQSVLWTRPSKQSSQPTPIAVAFVVIAALGVAIAGTWQVASGLIPPRMPDAIPVVALLGCVFVLSRHMWASQRREQVLHANVAQLNALLQTIEASASDAFIAADAAGAIVYISSNIERVCGLSASRIYAGASVAAIFGLETASLSAQLTNKELPCAECRVTDQSGRARTLAIRVRSLEVADGALLFLLRDNTNCTQVEADLQRERQFYEHIVSDSPLLIVAMSVDGAVEFANAAVTHVTGYQPEELIGRNWWRLLYSGDEYAQVETLLADEANFRVRDYQMTLTTKDRQKRVVAWNAANILDSRKRVTTIVGIGRDVTDHNQLEVNLRQAQKMEAIGRLAGGIAHDFNNLLTIILGNHDLLLDSLGEQPQVSEPLQELGQAATRAASLTHQLLTFSRQQPTTTQIADLNELVRGMASLLNRILGDDIKVRTRLDAENATVEIDAARFEQILLNLAINARDAMPAGGTLAISTSDAYFVDSFATPSTDIEPGAYVMLSIIDTGSGISPGVLEHIFEPFYTTKDVGKGTGMGLATVYGIVKHFNGHIHVESHINRGTTFHVYLPCASATDSEENEALRAASATLLPNSTILVVDDDSKVRSMASRILAAEDCRILQAESGAKAVSFVQSLGGSIDLLLTDVDMPELNGLNAASRLATEHPRLKVLFMTGHSPDRIVGHSVPEGRWAYIQKPFTKAPLVDAVKSLLNGVLLSGAPCAAAAVSD